MIILLLLSRRIPQFQDQNLTCCQLHHETAKRSAHITIEPNGILMTTINRSISTRSSSLRWKEILTENLKTFRSSEQKMTMLKEEWYRILNLKSCIAVWINFLRMNEDWSLQYILKTKRKTRSLTFYIPLSKTLTKRNVGFCTRFTNF